MADIKITVDIISGQAEAGLKKIENEAKRAERELGKIAVIAKTVGDRFNVFIGNVAAGAVLRLGSAIGGFAKDIFDATVEAEQLQTRLRILTKDADLAADVFRQVTQFAAGTPFQLTDIAKATNQLISFGFEARTITNELRNIGNVAAASGSDIKELSLIFGQIKAEGKLTGERLLQLQQRAIPIGPAIAQTLGIAESQLRDFVKAGKVNFDVFEQAFNSLSLKGGFAFQGLEKQSATLGGQLSNLQDNFNLLSVAVGEQVSPIFKEFVRILNESIQGVTRFVNQFSSDKITAEIAKIDTQIQRLRDSLKSTNTRGNVRLGFNPTDVARDTDAIKAKIDELLEKREQLLVPPGEKSGNKTDPRIERTQLTNQKLLSLEEEYASARAEREQQERAVSILLQEEDDQLRLENLTTYFLAQEQIRIDAQVRQLESEQKFSEARALLRQAEVNAAKAATAAIESENKRKVDNERSFTSQLTAVASSRNKALAGFAIAAFRLNQALALRNTILKAEEAAGSAYAFGSAIGGPALGAVFRVISYAATAAQIANIASQSPPSFEQGGIVPGNSFTGDNVAANVNSGEVILNRRQQAQTLFAIANGAGTGQGSRPIEVASNITVELDGQVVAKAVSRQVADGFELGKVV